MAVECLPSVDMHLVVFLLFNDVGNNNKIFSVICFVLDDSLHHLVSFE